MTKYEKIAEDVQSKIEQGEYKPNEQIPLVTEMCDTYGVSKITVKKAMDLLVLRGLIVKRRGAGSFVKNIEIGALQSFPEMSSQLSGFSADYANTPVRVTSVVHDFSIVSPSEKVADKLKITSGDFVYQICRTRLADGVPKVIEYTYMPIDVIPGLKKEDVEASIYHHIEKELGLTVYSAHRTVRAVMPTVLEKERLSLEDHIPLLEVEQVAFLKDGRIFEYSTTRHAGNTYEFYSISVRENA
ncbi:MAG: GntR family transcriptional regulator [Eubacteriaceae bacterium]|nr:GntR family transcriptional regulator [Eubacteriaceae bacterium]